MLYICSNHWAFRFINVAVLLNWIILKELITHLCPPIFNERTWLLSMCPPNWCISNIHTNLSNTIHAVYCMRMWERQDVLIKVYQYSPYSIVYWMIDITNITKVYCKIIHGVISIVRYHSVLNPPHLKPGCNDNDDKAE